MKVIAVFLLFIIPYVSASTTASGGVLAMSAASSLKNLSKEKDSKLSDFFAPKGGLIMEQLMLSVHEDMNHKGAVRVHVVVVYEPELVGELMKMSADHYFRYVDQLIKDYPDKMKIFEWELVAKKRVIPWTDVTYPTGHMMPLAGFVFANYSSTGDHRAKIPPSYKKIKITFKKEKFDIDYEDKDEDD